MNPHRNIKYNTSLFAVSFYPGSRLLDETLALAHLCILDKLLEFVICEILILDRLLKFPDFS